MVNKMELMIDDLLIEPIHSPILQWLLKQYVIVNDRCSCYSTLALFWLSGLIFPIGIFQELWLRRKIGTTP